MRLVFCVVQDKDAPKIIDSLVTAGFSVTRLASTGSFLQEGNTTLMTGVEDDKEAEVIGIVKTLGHATEHVVTPISTVGGPMDSYAPYPVEVLVGGATMFSLPVERFERL